MTLPEKRDRIACTTSPATDWTRRCFMQGLIAGAAAVLSACGAGSDAKNGAAPNGDGVSPGPDVNASPLANDSPQWTSVPPLTFTQGIASSISIAAFVVDANNDALTITTNAMPLPPGVTYDAAGLRFVYDGIGEVGETDNHVLTADDGRA